MVRAVSAKKQERRCGAPLAKISRPDAAGVMPRPRLYRIIEEEERAPIIFIVGPPGSGKTSFVSRYIEDRRIPFLWYSIDRGDADVGTFFYYLGLAAKRALTGRRLSFPAYSRDYELGASFFARRYFEILLGHIGGTFAFVFDNYQDLPADAAFHGMMSYMLSEIPAGIRVFIVSRKELPAPFARMQAHGVARTIGWDEMRFTREEVQQLIREWSRMSLTEEESSELWEKTDGWVTGLVLYLRDRRRKEGGIRWEEASARKNIADYFTHEVLSALDVEIRDFLLRTSFLPSMTPALVGKLEGSANADANLQRIVKECSFVRAYSSDSSLYEYHPLFREFLRERAIEVFDEQTLRGLKRNVAAVLEETGHIEEAARLFDEVGDTTGMVSLIRRWAPIVIRQGRSETLQGWLSTIPDMVLHADPWLLYFKGTCRLPFDAAESLRYFEEAFDLFAAQRDGSGAFLAWSGIVESIIFGREGLKTLDRWAELLEELLSAYGGFPSEEIESEVTYSVFRILALRNPQNLDPGPWMNRIQTIIETTTDASRKIKALSSLAGYLYSQGNFRALGVILDSLREAMRRHEVEPIIRLTADWIHAAYYDVCGLSAECQRVIAEGLAFASSLKITLMEYMLMGHGVLSALKGRDFPTAKRFLRRMVSGLPFIKPWEAAFYHFCAAYESLYRNNITLASAHAERSMQLYEGIGNPWTLTIAHLLMAQISCAWGDAEKAMLHVSEARSLGRLTGNDFTSFNCFLNEAYVNLSQGQESAALDALRLGLRVGRENGFMSMYMWPPNVFDRLMQKAIESGIEEDYAGQLVRRNDLVPDTSRLIDDRWPWRIQIYTLGRFGLLRDGEPVQFSGKIQQKPLMLLKALIALGGREVSGEVLTDTLWPDATGDVAHSAFTTTLSRLRRLLGDERAIRFADGKASLDNRYCWVDVWTFERLVGRALSLFGCEERDAVRDEAHECAEKAMRRYTGQFLAGEDESWIVSMRERLRSKFLRMVMQYGRSLERLGDFERAIECYIKGIEVDNLVEEFYQRTMRCYGLIGKRAEALAVYNRCRNVLSAVLGVSTSTSTDALARQLKDGTLS